MGYLLERKPAPTKALICTLAVALMLAGTRWGSYIGYSPLFLTDVLIAAAVAKRLLGRHGLDEPTGGLQAAPLGLFTAFYTYVAFRGILSFDHIFTMDWVRDLMPFLYGLLAFLAASDYARSAAEQRQKTMKYLWWALLFHLAWTAVMVLGKVPSTKFPNMPGSDVPFLSTRPDVDMAFLGLTAALLLRRLIRGECHRFWGTMGLLLAVVTTASMHSRAGLISLALALALSYALTYSSAPRRGDRRFMMVMALPVVVAVALLGIAQTTPGERMLATITNSSTGSLNEQDAQGTERARELVWDGVITWTQDSTTRSIIGSGFGNDFLTESGVIQYLEGTEYQSVRSPHNWFVGIYARMGAVGVGLMLTLLLSIVAILTRNRRRISEDELLATSALTLAVLIPVGSLGVVLESPFGAIPLWWSLGIIMTLRSVRDEKQPHPSKVTRQRVTAR